MQVTYEFPLFTDAHLIGEPSEPFGPYELINVVRIPGADRTRPAAVLRLAVYAGDTDDGPMRATDDARYHGGLHQDEIAALVSLCLGIRLKAGAMTRLFEPGGDTRGKPVDWGGEDPSAPPKPSARGRPVLPRALGEHSLASSAPLARLVTLAAEQSIALVRAARLYQDGLWMAESTPELSWLLLVAAIETAANFWRAATEPALDRFRSAQPELASALESAGGMGLLTLVADKLAPYMGATKTFIEFVLAFLPPPPELRPAEHYRLPWDRGGMKKAMDIIYKYRSRALHGGRPFPAPMCHWPFPDPDGTPSEICTPIAMGTRGGVWVAKDIPMSLHTFEHIVRGVLLNWWASLAADPPSGENK